MQLRIEGLSHRYGDVTVLEDIDLAVDVGRIVCLVGPSGCGKSTLLRLAGGLEQPESGRVLQVGDPPPRSLNPLTYIFQDFALLPWRTVAGNVSLALEDHPFDRGERAAIIEDVLDRTRLSEFREAFPRQLSGGMKQRVAIARALAVRPSVLLMDEPLSALDSQTRELMMDDLIDLWRHERLAGIYVTHNLHEAVRLGHEIVVMSRRPGRILERVTIENPMWDRRNDDPALEAKRRHLWTVMRDEARAVDQELTGA